MIKRRLLNWLLKDYYFGITEDDFVDLSKLKEAQALNYCLSAEEVYTNEVFQTELARLKFKQEQYLARKAGNADELLFGRSVLYIIDVILNRFESLSTRAKSEKAEQKRDVSTPNISGE